MRCSDDAEKSKFGNHRTIVMWVCWLNQNQSFFQHPIWNNTEIQIPVLFPTPSRYGSSCPTTSWAQPNIAPRCRTNRFSSEAISSTKFKSSSNTSLQSRWLTSMSKALILSWQKFTQDPCIDLKRNWVSGKVPPKPPNLVLKTLFLWNSFLKPTHWVVT